MVQGTRTSVETVVATTTTNMMENTAAMIIWITVLFIEEWATLIQSARRFSASFSTVLMSFSIWAMASLLRRA